MKNRNFLLTMILSFTMMVGFGNLAKAQCLPNYCGTCNAPPCGDFPITIYDSLPTCDVDFKYFTDPCGWTGGTGGFTVPATGAAYIVTGGCVCVPDCGSACAIGCMPANPGSGWGAYWSANSSPVATVQTYVDNTSIWALGCCPNGVKYVLTFTGSFSCLSLTIVIKCA